MAHGSHGSHGAWVKCTGGAPHSAAAQDRGKGEISMFFSIFFGSHSMVPPGPGGTMLWEPKKIEKNMEISPFPLSWAAALWGAPPVHFTHAPWDPWDPWAM